VEYGKKAEMIAYGGDHVLRQVSGEREVEVMEEYGVVAGEYAMSICRIEPENNCHLILEAFEKSGKRLVFVGNWERSAYGKELKERYGECENIRLVNSVYDLDVLYVLRKNARWYVHGHSAGGTNPSLVEAMFFGIPILAYDVVYNRETTENSALYFKTSDDICRLLECDVEASGLRDIAERRYRWKTIAGEYERMY
jgi:glycosyltransferase involved in cell wall biosynthesis